MAMYIYVYVKLQGYKLRTNVEKIEEPLPGLESLTQWSQLTNSSLEIQAFMLPELDVHAKSRRLCRGCIVPIEMIRSHYWEVKLHRNSCECMTW